MNKENIVFIPGWLDEGRFCGYENSLDIWTRKDLGVKASFKEKLVVAHSAGAVAALLNWEDNKESKFIFFGPMFPKRSFFSWVYRWFMFIFNEGVPRQMRSIDSLKNIFWGLKVLRQIAKVDSLEILKKIPKEKVIIVRGAKDKYFCNEKVCEKIRKEGFNVFEIEDAGHNWTEEVNKFLNKYYQYE